MKTRPAVVHSEPEQVLVRGHEGHVVPRHHQSDFQQATPHSQTERGVLNGGETLSQIHAFY